MKTKHDRVPMTGDATVEEGSVALVRPSNTGGMG